MTAEDLKVKLAEALGLPTTATGEQILAEFHRRRRDRQMLGAAAERILRSSAVPVNGDDGEPLPQYARLNLLNDSGAVALPAIDRLLSILRAPLCYEGGEPLTREERIEWAIRRAPKT